MGSTFHGTTAAGTTDVNSRDIQLAKRGNESTAGFARLAEQQGDLPGTVNEVSAAGRGGKGGKEGIMKRESFELRYMVDGREVPDALGTSSLGDV